MKLLNILTTAAIVAALLPTSILQSHATEEEKPLLRADVNGDYIINSQDMVLLSKYLLGAYEFSEDEAFRADYDGDGTVDTFDLISLRQSYIRNAMNMPKGTWVGEGFNGTRYFWFDENDEGTFVRNNGETIIPFSFDKSGTLIMFTLSSGKLATASIAWIDEAHFYLDWGSTNPELFTYKSDSRFDKGPYLKGEYVSDAGNSYTLNTYSGACNGDSISVLPMGTRAQFIYDDDTVKEGAFSRMDKNHFTLKWDDGTTENFTRREITVKDGITYVNGILIANKTYALPSTYAPGGLMPEFNTAFSKMQKAALKDGMDLQVCSGYRSYSYQAQLYNGYVARDGKAAADTYSARPGHSEHQTGLAADINFAGDWFNTTPEAKWLAAHCHEYGFIIRYPYGKDEITGYKYEGWHIRYLGDENAKLVHDSGLTLEEYLAIDSKYSY